MQLQCIHTWTAKHFPVDNWSAQSQCACVCVCVCLFVYFDGGSVDGGLEQRHIKTRGGICRKPQRPRGLHSRFVVQARIHKKQNDFLLTHNWLAPRALRARGARMRRFAPQSGASRRLVLINFWLNSRPFERNATLAMSLNTGRTRTPKPSLS